MSILTGVAVYFVTWWTCLFVVLPWGNKPSVTPSPGNSESAPENPRLFLKCIITSFLSLVIWVFIWSIL